MLSCGKAKTEDKETEAKGATVSVTIKGSDTVLPLAQKEAEDLMKSNTNVTVTVVGGGSGVGITALVDGTTDIAMASRDLKTEEKLKLLDKNWSGPNLCERLCNQLAGDYLRHGDSRSGVFLLVWQGQVEAKSWQINGETVELTNLENGLRKYWQTISKDFPHIDGIEVLVVDLTKRKLKAAKA